MNPPTQTAPAPFKTAFCRVFNLSEERFEHAVLRRCFPGWSRALGLLVLSVNPGIFRRELRTISQLGQTTDSSQFASEFQAYMYETMRDKAGFRTRTLGMRLSRRRFERLAAEVRRRDREVKAPEAAEPSKCPPAEAANL